MKPVSALLYGLFVVVALQRTEHEVEAMKFACSRNTTCFCEENDGLTDLWCPNETVHSVRVEMQNARLTITCNHENIPTTTDLLTALFGLNVGPTDSIIVVHCPIPNESYQRLFSDIGVTNLKALRIKYGTTEEDSSLVQNQFEGLTSLTDLEIWNANANIGELKVHPKALNGLTELKYLAFTSNGISHLPEELLAPVPTLEELHILEKNIPTLPDNFFLNQQNLKTLKIRGESLEKFQASLFKNLSSLTSLNLMKLGTNTASGNLLTFESGVFDGLSGLLNFSISATPLDGIPENIFSKTSLLERIEISAPTCGSQRRPCNVIVPSIAKNVPSLQAFRLLRPLSAATRVEIPSDFFLGAKGLVDIELSQLRMIAVPPGLFKDCTNLKKLDLRSNAIESLPQDIFSTNRKLKVLILKENKLSDIKNIISSSRLNNLVTFDLSSNLIVNISDQDFPTPSKLEEVDLSNNKISFNSTNHPKLETLKDLRVLNLNQNKISLDMLPFSWRTNLPKLETLVLSQNFIGPQLTEVDFDFKQTQISINLSNNSINSIILDGFKEQPSGRSGINVDLSKNPYICNCKSYLVAKQANWRQHYDSRPRVSFRGDSFACNSPAELKGQMVRNVDLHLLNCKFPSPEFEGHCPEPCDCSYFPDKPKVSVNCSRKNLTQFPPFVPIVRDVKEVYLCMADNNLKSASNIRTQVLNSSSIYHLDLSRNHISRMERSDLPSNLTSLYLDGNNIGELDEDFLRAIRKLSEVKLGDNPYHCDCGIIPLKKYVQEGHVSDASNVKVNCKSRGEVITLTTLAEADDEKLCTDVRRVIVSYVLPVIVILLLVFAVIIIGLVYKDRILVWLYSHGTIRKLFPIDLDDEEKTHDAFISYSESDSDYVIHDLLPGLEASNDIRYKCLVHVRDFVPGRAIYEQILEAVENSSRTVIVLSKNFVASNWAMQEFAAAHAKNKVIVIVYGELPAEDEMGRSLSDYIHMNTYVKHDDPWFWRKLRYALPHRGGWRQRTRGFKFAGFRKRHDTDQMQLVNGSRVAEKESSLHVVVSADGVMERDAITSTPPPVTATSEK